jgi:hypothetical protein
MVLMIPSKDFIDITLGGKEQTFQVSYTVSAPEPDVGYFSPIIELMWVTNSDGKFVSSELIHELVCDKIREYLP